MALLPKNKEIDRELYGALMCRDRREVTELCKKVPEGPLHTLTIHGDTVLHMAAYSKQQELVLDLLQTLSDPQKIDKMTIQNHAGNTVLHEAAVSNCGIRVAEEMLRKAPKLLELRNLHNETALFQAARYGKLKMFQFLEREMDQKYGSHRHEEVWRKSHEHYHSIHGTSILHIAVITEHFDSALYIAQNYDYLLQDKDQHGMTALQLLSCNPSAFKDGKRQGYLQKLIYACVPMRSTPKKEQDRFCRVPLFEAVQARKLKNESAMALAKFLIAKDTSWKDTKSALDPNDPMIHKYGSSLSPSKHHEVEDEDQETPKLQDKRTKEIAETPLFLATKSGILEIVEAILNLYPQAVEHIDDEGRNILHVAIKYRHIHIFDYVEKLKIPMMRLRGKIDGRGNSILHMVGDMARKEKIDDPRVEDLKSPAFLLQENLLLYERVEKISKSFFTKHRNDDGKTAEQLFATNNAQLQKDSKEWLKSTAEHFSIVAVLIATVAFAAAYTVPGGANQDTGYPILSNQPFFVIFTLTDVLSLTFALTSVIMFLSILTSSFRLHDFKQSLLQKLMIGVTLLILSVSMMMLSFAATVILLIHNKEQWTRVALYFVGFLPVSMFALTYFPLYKQLTKTFTYTLQKAGEALLRFDIASVPSRIAKLFKAGKTRSSSADVPAEGEAISSSCPPAPDAV